MAEIKITTPWVNMELSPNRKNGKSAFSYQRQKQKERSLGARLAKSVGEMVNTKKDITLTLYFYMPDNKKRDLDNMEGALKARLDGFSKTLGFDDYQFNPIFKRRFKASCAPEARVEMILQWQD